MTISSRVTARIGTRRDMGEAPWSIRVAAFALVLMVVAWAAHRLALIETVPFLVLLGVVSGLALMALGLAARGFWRLWTFGDRGGRASLFGAFLACLVLVPFVVALWRYSTLPHVNDVSTDMTDPPVIAGLGRPSSEAARLVAQAYPEVTGRRYTATADRVADAIRGLVAARGWAAESPVVAPAAGGEATAAVMAMTPVVGMPLRVALRITDEDETTFVDMRSASVYGPHDLGDNAALIGAFLADLDERMASEAVL